MTEREMLERTAAALSDAMDLIEACWEIIGDHLEEDERAALTECGNVNAEVAMWLAHAK